MLAFAVLTLGELGEELILLGELGLLLLQKLLLVLDVEPALVKHPLQSINTSSILFQLTRYVLLVAGKSFDPVEIIVGEDGKLANLIRVSISGAGSQQMDGLF